MRILGICHQFPPIHETGTEILCLATMQALHRRGHIVSVVTTDPERRHKRPVVIDSIGGVTVFRVPTARLLPEDTPCRMRHELVEGTAQHALRSIVCEQRPDIVHVHHSFGFGLPALAAMARDRSVVATVTDYAPVCPYATLSLPDGKICAGPAPDRANCVAHLVTGSIADRLLRRVHGIHGPDGLRGLVAQRHEAAIELFRFARCIVVASPAMRDALAFAGLPTDRVRIIPHRAPPVSVPESTLGSPLRIGFLGTLRPHKGAHVFMEAARALPREMSCEVIIRGDLSIDLEYVAKLKQMAGSDPRIQVLDKVPYSRFGEAIGPLDVVVIPSLWAENLPLVLLTAIEHGRYVVTSDMPGLVAAVGSDQGAIVPAGDASALAAVLESLIRNPAPVRTIRVRKTPPSSFESYVDDLEAMYARARVEDGVRAA